MRLISEQILSILTVVHQWSSENVAVYLFGSRLSDHGEGGDVDLVTLNRGLLTSEKNHLVFSEGEI